MEFKDPRVQRVIEALHELHPDYLEKRAGAEFNWIVTTLANRFQSDRHAIFASLGAKPEAKPPSGRAKIQRGRTKHQKSVAAAQTAGDCPSCPGATAASIDLPNKPLIAVANPSHFATVAQVLERFNNNVGIMTIYCQQNKIALGRATRLETVAQRIVNHYNPGASKSEEE